MARRKMSPAKKRAFLKRMAAGKRKKARGRKRNPTRAKTRAVARRAPNPRRRRRAPVRRRATRRRRNPTKLVGVPVVPAAYEAAGVAAGAYFGGAATNAVSDKLVGRLPANLQSIGFAVAGLGSIILGKYLKKKKALRGVPIDTVGIALAVPMFLRAFEGWGIPGFGLATTVQATNADTGETETVSMGGALAAGRLPGMGGTITRGRLPGMAGSIYPRMGMGRMTVLQRVH
ncbi:MAG: hypothetical protein ACYTG0_12705 [Planctomycetota bacterium]|jgi:hypothetical protein